MPSTRNTSLKALKQKTMITNVRQVLDTLYDNKKTRDLYYDAVEKVCGLVFGKKLNTTGRNPVSLKQYRDALKNYDKLIQVLEKEYPTIIIEETDNQEDYDTKRKNKTGVWRMFFTAVNALQKNELTKLDDALQQKYKDKLKEISEFTNEEKEKNAPTPELEALPEGVDWNLIKERLRNYWMKKNKTKENLKKWLACAMYVYINPRRAEYKDLIVYEKSPPNPLPTDLNYIVIDKNINMVLNAFKTRWRMKKEILPPFTIQLPKVLADEIKLYVKKANIKTGEALFQNDKGYEQAQFSQFIKNASISVLSLKLGINSYRHLFFMDVATKINDISKADRDKIAISCGDTKWETSELYLIVSKNSQLSVEESGNIIEKETIESDVDINQPIENVVVDALGIDEKDIRLEKLWAVLKPILKDMMK